MTSFVATSVGLALLLVTTSARSEEPSLSNYERETVSLALAGSKLEVEPAPEGKIVEEVIVRPFDVLEPRDPLPMFLIDFLNIFHVTTKPFVIRRHVLMSPGEPYQQELADETARNLRAIRQLSLVLVVPLQGSAPDKVKLLVIAKDIWSLRLNSDFRLANDQLEYLLLAPSEENLAGLHHSGSLRFELQPDIYAFGLSYRVPRIAASFVQASVSTNFIVNRESGALEGSFGSFAYGLPLVNTRSEWSWIVQLNWRSEITRYFNGVEPLTFDAESTRQDDAIPITFASESLAGRSSFIRSFGRQIKHNISFGAEASRLVYRAPDLSEYAPAAAREYVDTQIPLSDTRVYPYIGYSSYTTKFKSFVDFETLGLQEDYRIGHDVYIKAYPVIEELGSSRSYLGVAAGASGSAAMGDGHARAYAQGKVEAAPEQVYDANMLVGAHVVSPRFTVGRLVADGFAFRRFENFLNRRTSIGGEGRMRGYPSGAYRGENVLAANLELRTRPAELWTVQLGATAFFDTGAAWDRGETPMMRQSIGTGLRLVFPQLERSVMRFDWAVPLELDPQVGVTSILPGRFIVTFDQAFSMPSVDPPYVTD